MNQNVHKLMLSRFIVLYGAPQAPETQAFIDEYHRALKGYTSEALQHGADLVIKQNTFRSWPTVGECVKACDSYRPPRQPIREFEPGLPAPTDPETPEQRRQREAFHAETMRMLADFKASIASNNVIGGKDAGKRTIPNRTFFENRKR